MTSQVSANVSFTGSITTQALEVAGSAVVAGTVSAGNPLMFRNALYNGDFRIAQRGTSFSSTGAYTLDRWYIASSTGALTVSQIQSGLANFSNAVQIQTTSTTSQNIYLSQSLETRDVVRFQGQTVTVSFWYRTPTSSTGGWAPWVWSSTANDTKLTDISSGTGLGNGGMPNTTAWTYAQFSVFVPNTVNSMSVMFLTFNNVVNGAQFQLTGVQLEKGSVATPFEVRPYATELALCQRYYQEVPNVNGVHFTGSGRTITTNNGTNSTLIGAITFPTPMRASPTPAHYGGGGTGNFSVATASSGSQVDRNVAYSNVQASGNMSGTLYGFNVLNGGAVTTTGGSAQWIDMGWSGAVLGMTFAAEL